MRSDNNFLELAFEGSAITAMRGDHRPTSATLPTSSASASNRMLTGDYEVMLRDVGNVGRYLIG